MRPSDSALARKGESTPFPELPYSSLIAAGSRGTRPGPRGRQPGPGSKTPSSRSGAPSLSCSHLGSSRGHARVARASRTPWGHGVPGHDGAARTFERSKLLLQGVGESLTRIPASQAPTSAGLGELAWRRRRLPNCSLVLVVGSPDTATRRPGQVWPRRCHPTRGSFHRPAQSPPPRPGPQAPCPPSSSGTWSWGYAAGP